MNETSNVGLDITQFSILEEGKIIFSTSLDLQSYTSQYDMIHDRKNQTSKPPFLLGELTTPIQLVKVFGVPNSLSHRKCL